MKLALTGATGFLGRHVVRAALAAGHEVRVLVRRGHAAPEGAIAVAGALPIEPGSCDLDEFVGGADVLVHLAALGVQSRDRDWQRATDVNVTGTVQLVRAACAAGVKRVVLAGTCLEYAGHGRLPDAPVTDAPHCHEDDGTEPTDLYGATKAAGGLLARAVAREAGVECWYLRYASMYGPGDDAAKLLPAAFAAARAGRAFEMSPGAQLREWLHLDDATAATMRAIETSAPAGGAVVNIGTGEGIAISALVRRVFELSNADPALVKAGARPYRAGDVHRLVMDVTRQGSLLGFAPRISLDDGLRALVGAVP